MTKVSGLTISGNFLLYALIVVSSLWFYQEFKVGSFVLPNIFPLICVVLLVGCFDKSRRPLKMVAVLAMYTLFISMIAGWLSISLKGVVQLSYSIFIALLAMDLGLRVDKRRLISFNEALIYVVVILSFLEVIGVLRSVVLDIREFLYYRSVYESFDRDVAQYGFVRPTLLTKEPAHLALFFSLISTCKILYADARNRIAWVVCLFLIGVVLMRSPIVFLIPLSYLSIFIFSQSSLYSRVKYIFLSFIVGSLFLVLFFYAFSDRMDYLASGEDFSATNRILGLPFILHMVLSEHFLFGVGLSNDILLSSYIEDVFWALGFKERVLLFDEGELADRVTNYLVQSFLYFGVLGAVLFYGFLGHLLKRFYYLDVALPISVFFLFSLGLGAFVTVQCWVMLSVLIVYSNIDFSKEAFSK